MKLYDEATNEQIELPCDRETFKGETVTVLAVEKDAHPGSSGKIRVRVRDEERTFFPGVVRAYIADAPRA